jgi:GlpG protein
MPTCVECGVEAPRESMFGAAGDLRCPQCADRRRQVYAPPVRRRLRVDGHVTKAILAAAVLAFLGDWAIPGFNNPNDPERIPTPYELLGAQPLQVWDGEVWRLATSSLIHGGVLHLLFNGYWLWRFGPPIEAWMGRLLYVPFVALLASTSAAAEMLADPSSSIGLSGVVYGMFGLLFALRKQKDFAAALMDPSTVQLMIGWFFLCILLTASDLMPIANFAHAGGAALGYVFGRGWLQRSRIPLTAAVVAAALCVTAAATYMPWDYSFCKFRAYKSFLANDHEGVRLWQQRAAKAWNSQDPAPRPLEDQDDL